jgi:hypothetical protein
MADSAPDEPAKSPKASYEEFWGEEARLVQVKVDPRCTISLPDRFLRGPLARIVTRKLGSDDAAAIQTFCHDAVLAWYERYRERKARATPERHAELLALVPTPQRGEPMGRIAINLEDAIKPEAFGRVLAVRFRATGQGRSMAMREAILEALLEARGV